MVLKDEVKLDSTFVADHTKETSSVIADLGISNVWCMLFLDKGHQHDLPHSRIRNLDEVMPPQILLDAQHYVTLIPHRCLLETTDNNVRLT